MTVLRLELDIDSDVYPELYARLAIILDARGRGERMRQLAASGLVWEMLRLEGQAPSTVPPPAAAASKPAPPKRKQPAVAPAAPQAARSAATAPPFVDLAIDAPPALRAAASGDAGRAPEAIDDDLPVLTDVLEPAPVREAADGSQDPPAADAHHMKPLWPHGARRGPATRSRLIRMKERGLFKNG